MSNEKVQIAVGPPEDYPPDLEARLMVAVKRIEQATAELLATANRFVEGKISLRETEPAYEEVTAALNAGMSIHNEARERLSRQPKRTLRVVKPRRGGP